MRQTRRMGARAGAVRSAVPRPHGLTLPSRWVRALQNGAAWLRDAGTREAAALEPTTVVAVGLGIGVGLYFAAPEEPGFAGPLIAFFLAVFLAYRLRRQWWLYILCVGLAAIAAGFSAGKLRTLWVDAPRISRPVTADLAGLILSHEPRTGGSARLILRPTLFNAANKTIAEIPSKIRVTVRQAGEVQAGDIVSLKALLRPPPLPAVPGGFDFARDAFFDGVGAVGFVAGKLHSSSQASPESMTPSERFGTRLDRARNDLTYRIAAAIPGENGAIAASLVTGKRGLIPQETNAVLRASGLYHVVSISGLHMAIFASGLFWLIRAILAFSPRLALTFPLKRIAAILALLPALAYTIFSGGEVATIRAFVMTAIVLSAIVVGRHAITRRNVGLAASLILLLAPEELLGPSFQMSFAAVALLVAWYDRPRNFATDGARRHASGFGRVAYALLLTTLIASLATAPFAAFHFHRLTLQSLVSNALATPLVSVLIMPLGLLALIAEPFGYGLVFWQAMGVAVDWFMAIARMVASWPGADVIVPRVPMAALLSFALALLMLAVMRTRLIFAAAAPVAAGLFLFALAPRPLAIVGSNGHAVLVQAEGKLRVIAGARDAFAVQEWLLSMGDRRSPKDPSLADGVLCDAEGCSAALGSGRLLILDKTINAIAEDCGRVAILVAPLNIPFACEEKGLTIDRTDIEEAGSIEIYEEPGAKPGQSRWRLVKARDPQTVRPWSARPLQMEAKLKVKAGEALVPSDAQTTDEPQSAPLANEEP